LSSHQQSEIAFKGGLD